MQAYCWLILFVVFLVAELLTLGLTTVWFAGGSIAAFLAALAGTNIYVQIIIFLAVSIALLLFTRPFAKRYINEEHEKTNVDSLVGQEALVTEPISNRKETGHVRLNGVEWMARTEDPAVTIGADSLVNVLRIEGAKVIVEEKKESK